MYFLGYSNTSKAYGLYDEDNMKFIISRDVIFLEFEKDALTIDKQHAHLDRFHSKKIYHEMDNWIPNLEGGIPVLSQFLEFPSIATSFYNAQDDDSNAQVDET